MKLIDDKRNMPWLLHQSRLLSLKSVAWNWSQHRKGAAPAGIFLLKVNNRNITTRCEIGVVLVLYCYLCTYFTPCSSVSIINFEQVIAAWANKSFWTISGLILEFFLEQMYVYIYVHVYIFKLLMLSPSVQKT